VTGHAGRIEAGIWNRPYVLCLAANFLIFYVVTSFVLYPLLIKDSGGTDTQVGLIMGVFSVVAVLLRPVTGMAAERLSYRAVALFGLATMAALVPFFSLVEPVGWPVVMLRALFGVGWSCILAPLMALATRLTPANHLSEALGIFGISGLLAHALSPMISELVVARSGFQTLFILDCLLAVMAMGLVAAVPSGRNMPDAPPGSTPPRASGRLLMAAIAGVVLVAIAHGAVRGTNLNFIGPYCRFIGIERFFPFFIAFSFSAIATRFRLAALPDRYGQRRVAIPALLLVAANSLIISQIHATWLLIVAGLIGGLGQGLIFPALSSLMVDLIGHHRRAFALSVYATCFEIGFGFGLPVFGLVADYLGYRWMYAASGFYMFATIFLFIRLVPPEKRQPAPQS
jgi:MFS family permease